MTIREKLLAASKKTRTATVEIPEWDGVQVTVRGLTATEYYLIIKGNNSEKINGEQELKAIATAVALCLLDEDGSQMFVGEDAKLVKDWPIMVLDTIWKGISRVSNLTEDEKDGSAKNSETPQLNGSLTG